MTMTLYYLDSTAWLQYYVREAGSDEVAELFKPSVPLACAAFGFVEVIVTLSRLAHSGAISHEDLQHKVHDIENDWSQFLQIYASPRVIKLTESIALKHNFSPERALHIASVLWLRESSTNADVEITAVSTDTEFLATVVDYGFTAKNPAVAIPTIHSSVQTTAHPPSSSSTPTPSVTPASDI
jgi:predicted nucleic acid-binding protein